MGTTLSLVADIGGTNTRVALADGKVVRQGSTRRFRNADHPGLETILRLYLDQAGVAECGGTCVAIAGPVRDGVASMTNLDWTIDNAALTRATGAERVAILNDLQAQGHALGHIAADKLAPVIEGPAQDHAAKLVVGAGTGFNAAPVHETPWGRIVAASECGHINMPIRTEADLRLARFVETAHGFPGVEDVLAGRGLERLYVRLMGAELANLALTHLPFGGIFLIGGVARAFQPFFTRFDFAGAFRDKGRFAGFMANFAVTIIEDDYAALTGCAVYLEQGGRG